MKKYTLLFPILFLFAIGIRAQNVNVAGAISGNGLYLNLGAAFNAINAGAQNGATILITIIGNTTETATATLNQGTWATLTISPAGGFARTIQGNLATALITFNSADRVVIDGLNSGGNSLTINNTNTGTTSTIRYMNDARSHLVQNRSEERRVGKECRSRWSAKH